MSSNTHYYYYFYYYYKDRFRKRRRQRESSLSWLTDQMTKTLCSWVGLKLGAKQLLPGLPYGYRCPKAAAVLCCFPGLDGGSCMESRTAGTWTGMATGCRNRTLRLSLLFHHAGARVLLLLALLTTAFQSPLQSPNHCWQTCHFHFIIHLPLLSPFLQPCNYSPVDRSSSCVLPST